MKITKKILMFMLCLCLGYVVCVSAGGVKEEVLDLDPLIEAIDTNQDGCMSLEEWQAAEMPMSSFNMLAQDGYVTKEIMLNNDAPDGIDLNGDGVLTLEEFLEFDKLMAPKVEGAEKRPIISTAERALAMLMVQNTMSKHAYYHAAGKHIEELKDIWVDQNGPYAENAKWSNPMGVWEGMDLIMDFYGIGKVETLKNDLKAISEIYPEIKNIPENIGIGGEWAMHTQTTAIIEVAGDGKTAKAIWYSPGIALGTVIKDGKAEVRGNWFWEKYAVDFVNEDGEWKIWHLQTYYDNTPPNWGAEAEALSQTQATANQSILPDASRPNPDPYQAWSPTTLPRIQPKWPEPYYTFSETFSY